MPRIKPGKYGAPATREQLEAELKRRGWRYVAPKGERFNKGRWQSVETKGLWFRPAKLQAEYGGKVRGLLFVNAAIEEGLEPEPSFVMLHSRYMTAIVSSL